MAKIRFRVPRMIPVLLFSIPGIALGQNACNVASLPQLPDVSINAATDCASAMSATR